MGIEKVACSERGERKACRMARKIFHCYSCGQPEDRCNCEKYCALCHADYGVRLTEDGQYYCLDCREACDYKTQDAV